MYLALFRAKICPECGIWPLGRLKMRNLAKMPYYILSSTFSRLLKAFIAFLSSAFLVQVIKGQIACWDTKNNG